MQDASDWQDTSGRGENWVKGDCAVVGSHLFFAYWHGVTGVWAWHVERVNKTGRTVLRDGFALSVGEAMRAAEEAERKLRPKPDMPLFTASKEDNP